MKRTRNFVDDFSLFTLGILISSLIPSFQFDATPSARPAFFRLNEDLLPMVQSRTQMIPKLKEFRRPVRIIFGDADPSLNSGVARSFHEFLPGSELFLIPGARHFVQLDEPEQVARLILAMSGPADTPVRCR
jgi:haloalkane dehalogenase